MRRCPVSHDSPALAALFTPEPLAHVHQRELGPEIGAQLHQAQPPAQVTAHAAIRTVVILVGEITSFAVSRVEYWSAVFFTAARYRDALATIHRAFQVVDYWMTPPWRISTNRPNMPTVIDPAPVRFAAWRRRKAERDGNRLMTCSMPTCGCELRPNATANGTHPTAPGRPIRPTETAPRPEIGPPPYPLPLPVAGEPRGSSGLTQKPAVLANFPTVRLGVVSCTPPATSNRVQDNAAFGRRNRQQL